MSEQLTYQDELDVALRAVVQASWLCRAVRVELGDGILSKSDRSPVTVADFGSQAVVCRELSWRFPSDPVMAEEDSAALREPGNETVLAQTVDHVGRIAGLTPAASVCAWIDRGNLDASVERYWVLDPIDGTKGFLRGDQYAIALALVEEGEIRVAALACPELDVQDESGVAGVLFAAVRGQGAWEAPLGDAGARQRISVSSEADAAGVRLCESVEPSHSHHELAAVVLSRMAGPTGELVAEAGTPSAASTPVRLDSQAKYGVVARGGADLYMRLPTQRRYVERVWDHAAGALVVSEAGGTVTDVDGRPLDFTQGTGLSRNRGVVASNGLVHAMVISALAGELRAEGR